MQPTYYGAIIAAEAIGSSGSTKAVELTFANPRIAGYAFYESGQLRRALIINSQAFLKNNANGNRGTVHVDLTLKGDGLSPVTMSVKRLSIR